MGIFENININIKKTKVMDNTSKKLIETINQVYLNEETEQIDEISDRTLRNYVFKAYPQYNRAGALLLNKHSKEDPDWDEKSKNYEKIIRNRRTGMNNALDKIEKNQGKRSDEALIDKLTDALDYLSEEQLSDLASVINQMLEEE